MKKLLMVIPSLGTGGAERLVVDLINTIDKNRFDIYLLCLYKTNSKDEINRKRLNIQEDHIFFVGKKLGIDIKSLFLTRKIIKKIKPDIIHSHIDTVFTLLFSYGIAKIRLHTVHNIAKEEAKGIQYLLRKFAFKILKVKPIAISNLIKDSIAEAYKLKEDQVPVVFNGINTEFFKGGVRSKKEVLKIVAVGSFKAQKNYNEMMQIFLRLKGQGVCFHAKILGTGVLFDEIKKIAHNFDLEKEVEFIGEISDVKKYLETADLLLSTSLFEGLPISMLEGMANGLPIVATKVGGVPEIVLNGINGYLYTVGNVTEAVDCVKRIFESGKLLSDFSTNALLLSQKYDIKICSNQYMNIYEGL